MEIEDFFLLKRDLTEDEIHFLKKEIPKNRWRCYYAIWRQERKNDKYIALLIDFDAGCRRRAAIFRSIDIISERELTDIEYHEQILNFGGSSRRLKVWNYNNVSQLITDDQKYNIETPQKFIDEVKKRKVETNFQTQIEFQ